VTKKEKLIDMIAVFDDFRGDPTNPDDLYRYFEESGKVYSALAISGSTTRWQQDFNNADEYLRAAFYAALSHSACTLITHKTGLDVSGMGPMELAAQLHRITKSDTRTRYKQRRTGLDNSVTDSRVHAAFEQAYEALMAEKPARPPGRAPLLRKALALSRQNPDFRAIAKNLTEHQAKKFLSQKNTGEI